MSVFKRWLYKKILSMQTTPITHTHLKYLFFDENGRKYYSFDGLGIPIQRVAQAETYKMWMGAGLNPDNILFFVDESDKAVNNALVKDKQFAKNMARVSAINDELRQRCKYVMPYELIYNLLAVQIVREDENPLEYSNEIQLQKVEAFKKLDKESNYTFFLNIKEFQTLCASLNMSEEKWREYLTTTLNVEERYIKEAMSILSKER